MPRKAVKGPAAGRLRNEVRTPAVPALTPLCEGALCTLADSGSLFEKALTPGPSLGMDPEAGTSYLMK